MTLVAAWIRKNATLRELVIAADSRLSGGESWDVCPKIVALPRPATMIAMSGNAVGAYSFLLQAINTCALLDGHGNGRTDIGYLANTLRAAYADSRRHVVDLPFGESNPEVLSLNVALFGWSWRHLRFEGYSYVYHSDGQLHMHRISELDDEKPFPAYFFGDAAAGVRSRARELAHANGAELPMRGQSNAGQVAANAFFNWEPLKILLETIEDSDARTVGGAPQVSRIYQYGEIESFVWRSVEGRDYFGGRPVQPTEKFDRRIMQICDGKVGISFSDRAVATLHSTERIDH